MAARKKVAPKNKASKRLYRFYAAGPDGDDATTLAIVLAENDSEAFDLGFKEYPSKVMKAFSSTWGITDGDDEGPFYSAELLADRFAQAGDDLDDQVEDAEYVLGSMPGLSGSSDALRRQMARALVDIVSQEW